MDRQAGCLFDGAEWGEGQMPVLFHENSVCDHRRACIFIPEAAGFRDREGGPSVWSEQNRRDGHLQIDLTRMGSRTPLFLASM